MIFYFPDTFGSSLGQGGSESVNVMGTTLGILQLCTQFMDLCRMFRNSMFVDVGLGCLVV